jgi:hypothetical protein
LGSLKLLGKPFYDGRGIRLGRAQMAAPRGSFLVLWADIGNIGVGSARPREGFTAYSPDLKDRPGQE